MSIIDTRTNLKPIFEAKPDMRFATTFLSNRYRDHAINGETIMDKSTGEIFTKRKEDGRVVSFFQNKKYLDDLLLELRILLTSNPDLMHPTEEDTEAFYLSTDYDVMSINNERDISIKDNDIVIDDTSQNPFNKLRFKISTKSNGFFIRVTTRDCDKVLMEYATNFYNKVFSDYVAYIDQFIEEQNKFNTIENWADSNVVLNYTLNIKYRNNSEIVTYDLSSAIRANETSCVTFPSTISADMLSEAEYIVVKIKEVKFHKLHFLLEHKDIFTNFRVGFDKFINADNEIYCRYITIGSFLDKVDDLMILGNEFLVAMVDIPYVYRYMLKLRSLMADSSFILSQSRPSDEVWGPNNLWLERIRDVFKNGYEINLESETDIKQYEMYYANNDDTDYTRMSTDENDDDCIYVRNLSDS